MRAPVVIFGAVAAGMVMLANAAWALNLTPPHGRHVPPLRAAPVQPQTEEAVTDCDRLAASPEDSQKVVDGVAMEALDGTLALARCEEAAGRYERGHAPEAGAVMSFKKTDRNPFGHVAMVSKVVNDREVLLTHANWSRRGGVERDVRAVDVSDAGDWSLVKVYYAPTGGLGTTAYPTKGFIYSGHAPAGDDALDAPVQMADAGTAKPGPVIAMVDAIRF